MSKKITLSNSLVTILGKVNDKISTFLLDINTKEEVLELKYSYIDSDTDPTMLSYLSINREKGLSEEDKWKSKTRTSVKIGRVVRSILQSKSIEFTDSEIETFVAKYRCAIDNGNFVFNSGQEFGKYYNENTYDRNGGGSSLWSSCMRFQKCNEWFTIYKNNPQVVGVLALLNDAGKVEGRALIWKDILINGVVGTYMDRIYSISASVEEKFKQYASVRKWWCKIKQGNDYPNITNGEKVSANPVLKAQLRSDVNYNYKVKSPYIDSMRQMKILTHEGKYGVFLTNPEEGSIYRQNYSNHLSDVEINTNYNHDMDKSFSLSQIVGVDMNDLVMINKNTFKVGETSYNVYTFDEVYNTVNIEFVKNPFENMIKYGMKITPYINDTFYKHNGPEIIKYIKENPNKIWTNYTSTSSIYPKIFSKVPKEEFLGMVNAVLKDPEHYWKLAGFFQDTNNFGTVITGEPFSYDSWTKIRNYSELNSTLGEVAYYKSVNTRSSLYVSFGLYLEEYGDVETRNKYFCPSNIADRDDDYIFSLISEGYIKIDIIDYLNTIHKDLSDLEKFNVIAGYYNLSNAMKKYIDAKGRAELLSSDNTEHIVLRHYIYKV